MREKIRKSDELPNIVRGLRSQGRKIVFTNGCFDILHLGHVRYLEEAKRLGDVLIIGLNSDSSVRRIKGEGRPIVPEDERAEVLCALEAVDYVVIFNEDTPKELIELIEPDLLAKGADWREDEIVGRESVEKRGGKVVRVPFVEGVSTTKIIEKILKVKG